MNSCATQYYGSCFITTSKIKIHLKSFQLQRSSSSQYLLKPWGSSEDIFFLFNLWFKLFPLCAYDLRSDGKSALFLTSSLFFSMCENIWGEKLFFLSRDWNQMEKKMSFRRMCGSGPEFLVWFVPCVNLNEEKGSNMCEARWTFIFFCSEVKLS